MNVSSSKLALFSIIQLSTHQFVSIKYLQAHHRNGRNSAHRLSLASRMEPPCRQQQLAAVGQFLRWVLISSPFSTVLLLSAHNFFQIKYLQAYHRNGRNSAHRLSLAAHLALSCRQHHLGGAGER